MKQIKNNFYHSTLQRLTALSLMAGVLVVFIFAATPAPVESQQLQIPSLQVCNRSDSFGEALVLNTGRKDVVLAGTFEIYIRVNCSVIGGDGYPYGSIELRNIMLTDSVVVSYLSATTIEQVSTVGEDTPMIFIRGRCKTEKIEGCRYWLMIADNKKVGQKGTPDIVSLVVFDKMGVRQIYVTGEVVKGDLYVAPGV